MITVDSTITADSTWHRAPEQQQQMGSGPGPHGVKLEYENVVVSITGGLTTVVTKVKQPDDTFKEVVLKISQKTGLVQ
jgi:hypothetical protein